MTVDVQELLTRGYQRCSSCHGLTRPGKTQCSFCNHSFTPSPVTSPRPARQAGRGRTAKPTNKESARGRIAGRGWFADHPHGAVDLVVYGDPIAEGSTVAVAAGVVKHSDPKLKQWRSAITQEARRVCGPDWKAINAPVAVTCVFTVPLPAGAPATVAVPADGYRDRDKLLRAVGDALCPKQGFRMLASDMRTASSAMPESKTHPRPLHTHPCALDKPGVWIRVQLATALDPVLVDGRWMLQCPVPAPEDRLVSALHPHLT